MREDAPSSTAVLIAAAMVYADADPRYRCLGPVDRATDSRKLIAALPAAKRVLLRALCSPLLRWFVRLIERSTVPGIVAHFILRKRFIEAAVLEAIAEGASQVLVIGAGFDTLTLRLHRMHPHVKFVELDHAATQCYKRKALAASGVGENIVLRAFDLTRQTLQQSLSGIRHWNDRAKTVFVMEGVLMYLDRSAVYALFEAIARQHASHIRVVFSALETMPNGRIDFQNATWLAKRLLHYWREPFRSSMSKDELSTVLTRLGYASVRTATTEALRKRYFPGSESAVAVVAQGELLCVADRIDGRPSGV